MLKETITQSLSYGDYIILNGQRLDLKKHPTDFSIIGHSAILSSKKVKRYEKISANMTRVTIEDDENIDELMREARKDSIAHHIYRVEDTAEEIIIDDRIILDLSSKESGELEEIIQKFHLTPEGRMGNAYVLRVTEATGRNPLKVANEIAEFEGVAACSPQVMLEMELH